MDDFISDEKSRIDNIVIDLTVDENNELKEGQLDGMMSRVFQHEYDHMLGRTFVEHASKLKLDRAYKKAEKLMDKVQKQRALTK